MTIIQWLFKDFFTMFPMGLIMVAMVATVILAVIGYLFRRLTSHEYQKLIGNPVAFLRSGHLRWSTVNDLEERYATAAHQWGTITVLLVACMTVSMLWGIHSASQSFEPFKVITRHLISFIGPFFLLVLASMVPYRAFLRIRDYYADATRTGVLSPPHDTSGGPLPVQAEPHRTNDPDPIPAPIVDIHRFVAVLCEPWWKRKLRQLFAR